MNQAQFTDEITLAARAEKLGEVALSMQQFQIQILTMGERKQENRRTSKTEAQWSQ